jgi:hypothetical protein
MVVEGLSGLIVLMGMVLASAVSDQTNMEITPTIKSIPRLIVIPMLANFEVISCSDMQIEFLSASLTNNDRLDEWYRS